MLVYVALKDKLDDHFAGEDWLKKTLLFIRRSHRRKFCENRQDPGEND